ncbi:hypothetical protein ACQEVZ_08110 [Dactylosporangium sp. CA-152071]|uniref:hypothetical protein n=1 Tax=Dactylosporangium sp. CA-152071 TaxID=3239933 RepID=UPI003D92CDC8
MHRPTLRRGTVVPGAALTLLLLLPTAASAHGVDDAAGRSVPEFVVHGVGSLTRIVAFNLGIEGGQVIALVVVMLAAGYLPARYTSERARRVAATAIIVLGVLAATLVVVDRANRPAPAAAGPAWFTAIRSEVAE